MSMITENTIVVRSRDENLLLKDLANAGHVSGAGKVFENGSYAVFIFDNNGDMPWEAMEQDELSLPYRDIVVMETNYLDDDGYWTRTPEGDLEVTLSEWLANIFTEEECRHIRDKIRYTA